MNHYQILGVSENASDKDIKQAYRDLAKKWHPDVCKGNKTVAKQKFSDINKAWEILKDKIKKENYDRQLQMENLTKANLATNGNAIANMFAPYADDMSESSMNDDSDSPIKDHADFIRKFKALKREMRATGQLSGSETESEEYIDPRAEEKKRYNDFIEKMKSTGMDSDPRVYVTLEEMYMGATKKTRVKRRTGEFSEKEDFITVTVRPNAFEGDIVKVPGGGHFINFQNEPVKTPGDAMVCVTQIKHQIYERKFFDLHGTIDISVSEAENGFTRAVKGVDGEDIVITIPKLKRSDHIHKIYNKGMKRDIDGSRGHVYFGFVIVFDKNKDLEGENRSEGPKPDDKKKIEDKKKLAEKNKLDDDNESKKVVVKKIKESNNSDDNDDEQSDESEKIPLKKDRKKDKKPEKKSNDKPKKVVLKKDEKPKRGRPKRNKKGC